MNSTLIKIFGGLLTAGVGYCVIRVTDTAHKIDQSIRDVQSKTSIDISNAIVDKAVKAAAEAKAKEMTEQAVRTIKYDIEEDIRKKVSARVTAEENKIKEQVSSEIAEQIIKIDGESFREKVKSAAKDKMIDKFQKDLDELINIRRNKSSNDGTFRIIF